MPSPGLVAVQAMYEKAAYDVDDLLRVTGSRATAYRTLQALRRAGFAEQIKEGYFTIRSSLFQPFYLWDHLLPSLDALKQARYFGRSYGNADVSFARRTLGGMVTLDYRAYELTGLQDPHSFYVYVEDLNTVSDELLRRGFSEGRRGRVVLLPRVGSFQNELQRVYLDCIAYGGRSVLDAIAIELLYGDRLDPRVRGVFRSEDVIKVKEELASFES